MDGGCFTGAKNIKDCNAAWSFCAKANSMLANKRSYQDGTVAPLMVSEFQKLVPKLSGNKYSEAYVCVTKYDGYIPPEANIQRSKKACSTTG